VLRCSFKVLKVMNVNPMAVITGNQGRDGIQQDAADWIRLLRLNAVVQLAVGTTRGHSMAVESGAGTPVATAVLLP